MNKVEKLKFSRKSPEAVLAGNKNGILNFQNLYSVYLFNHESLYKNAMISKGNYTFPDGKILSIFLRVRQIRGPSFTRDFFKKKINPDKKHFIIGPSEQDIKILIEKFPKVKQVESHDPGIIKNNEVSKIEKKRIIDKLKRYNPDYVWVCVGNPRQEILANQLYKEHKTWYFNVGAAMDFLLEKKKEAPSLFRKIGLEWFYRLITDFKYSKKKVWRSLVALKYLKKTISLE
jgi:exopolysaccharide biosynthesis WecB/TagA/CpsF family protein